MCAQISDTTLLSSLLGKSFTHASTSAREMLPLQRVSSSRKRSCIRADSRCRNIADDVADTSDEDDDARVGDDERERERRVDSDCGCGCVSDSACDRCCIAVVASVCGTIAVLPLLLSAFVDFV